MPARDSAPGLVSTEMLAIQTEYLTFLLGGEEYAVPIEVVKELRAWQPVTRIPFAKNWECGLINVRGAIVPVFDLRMRIGLSHVDYNNHTVIVLFRVNITGKESEQGVVVDELTDVLQVTSHQIHTLTDSCSGKDNDFTGSFVESGGRKIKILDFAKLFSLQAE